MRDLYSQCNFIHLGTPFVVIDHNIGLHFGRQVLWVVYHVGDTVKIGTNQIDLLLIYSSSPANFMELYLAPVRAACISTKVSMNES